MNETIFEENINSLRKRLPKLADRIVSTEKTDHLEITSTPEGSPTLLYRTNGEKQKLHSAFHPKKEAERLIDDVEVKDVQTWFVLGFGLGYHLEEILEQAGPMDRIVVVEKEEAIFRKALASRDLRPLIESQKVSLFIGISPNNLYDLLRPHTRRILSNKIHIVQHPPSHQVHNDFYESVREEFMEFIEAGRSLMHTSIVLTRRTAENQFLNTADYLKNPGIKPFKNRYRGIPGFLVSAGPSLEKNVHLVEEASEKGFVFAVGTVLLRLLNAGVTPEFTGIVDYHRMSGRYFEGLENVDDIRLIADPRAAWEAIEKYEGPKSFFKMGFMDQILGRAHPDLGSMMSGSTVAHLGFHFLEYLGCDPIVLLGQDLAYPQNISHVPGTAIYDQWLGEINRFQTFEMKEMEFIQRLKPSLRTVENPDGEKIYTDTNMFHYLKEMSLSCRRSDRTCIDATEGGARIEGAKAMELQTVLDNFSTEAKDRTDDQEVFLTAETAEKRLVEGWEEINALKNRARKLFKYYEETLETLSNLEEQFERGDDPSDEVQQVLQAREKLKRFRRLYKILQSTQQAAEVMKDKEDRRIEAKGLEGREKQKAQVERNKAYIGNLRDSLEYVRTLIDRSLEKVTDELHAMEDDKS